MAQPQLTGEQLKQVIAETLSPYGETRRTGKSLYLKLESCLIFDHSLDVKTLWEWIVAACEHNDDSIEWFVFIAHSFLYLSIYISLYSRRALENFSDSPWSSLGSPSPRR
jgi:hypothetical protein